MRNYPGTPEIVLLKTPIIIRGRWYSRVKSWGCIAGGNHVITPPHYKGDRVSWIGFADNVVDPLPIDDPIHEMTDAQLLAELTACPI